MRNYRLALLFLANMIPLVVGMGLFPVLPLYAARFGATATLVGLLYAVTYAASVAGILLTAWLSERVPLRALFVAGGVLGIPALALLGSAGALWQVMILTVLIWFSGGVTITLVNVFTGLLADDGSRGASFSFLFMAYPLGAVVGGAAVGQLVAWQGYTPMFVALACFWVALPLIGLFGLGSLRPGVSPREAKQADPAPAFEWSFKRLLLAALFSALAINVSRLGTSLSMQALGFSAGAVASTAVVNGIVAAPISLLIGALSDRLGYRRVLFAGYTLGIGGALLLRSATQLWQFCLAATLLFVAWCVNGSVTSALAADTLPQAALGRGLPRLNATDSLASILGFALAGYLMDTLGGSGLYLIAVGLAVLAAPLLPNPARRRLPLARVTADMSSATFAKGE
jgi:AAHS family 4-hydroxybenzoate transporter-like MFS transporter